MRYGINPSLTGYFMTIKSVFFQGGKIYTVFDYGPKKFEKSCKRCLD
jgi:hypothetical protein